MCTKYRGRFVCTENQEEATETLGHHNCDQGAGGAGGDQGQGLGLIWKVVLVGFANGNSSQRAIFSQS